ncbi:tail fiber assembly protein [Providencia sp. PROV205]|uniref:tail fiber assembly protein n=1 Tax=Providencia sp. PROV205 TaxID=2949903 RepID=UPI00234ACA09|nr:tail fiber assembly protein [Providencia sp. PROV205]
MNYYKDKTSNVFAYDDRQLAQISRLSELENLIPPLETVFIDAKNSLHQAEVELTQTQALLEQEKSKQVPVDIEDSEAWQKARDERLLQIELSINIKLEVHNEALIAFNQSEHAYQPLKDEYDAILPVFFEIREHLKTLKKMTPKDIELHLNPPVSKEQLIAEAEQQKQSLLAEANNAIAPLQDAVDLDMATEEEMAALQKWKTYRVLLNRVDTSLAPDIDWPEKP